MTWAMTPRETGAPLTEGDFQRRKPHPDFVEHYNLENEVIRAGEQFPNLLMTFVITSGITYGYEEDKLHFLFYLCWKFTEPVPVFAPGRNRLPLIHVTDLAAIVYAVIVSDELTPGSLFAIENGSQTLLANCKAISKVLGDGKTTLIQNVKDLPHNFGISETTKNILSADILMKSEFAGSHIEMVWRSGLPFDKNITAIVREFLDACNLHPLMVMIHGPPGVGKTRIAKRFSALYDVEYLEPWHLTEGFMSRLIEARDEARRRGREVKGKAKEERGLRGEGSQPPSPFQEIDPRLVAAFASEHSRPGPISVSCHLLETTHQRLGRRIALSQGRFDDAALLQIYAYLLASKRVTKRGYVLDGFPETWEQARLLFPNLKGVDSGRDGGEGTDDEEEEEDGDEVADGGSSGSRTLDPPLFASTPNLIISLEADFECISKRVAFREEKDLRTHLRRFSEFRALNDWKLRKTVLDFFEQNGYYVNRINVEFDRTDDLTRVFAEIVHKLAGPPRNFDGRAKLEKFDNMYAALCDQVRRSIDEESERVNRIFMNDFQLRVENWGNCIFMFNDQLDLPGDFPTESDAFMVKMEKFLKLLNRVKISHRE